MYPQAVLSFTLPSGEKRIVPLLPTEPVLIGRNRASTIKLNLPSVSRQHARIIYERDIFWIEDLGSSNGTFVNQKQIQKARINIGDVLKCGDFVIAVRNGSDRSSLPPHGQVQAEKRTSNPPRVERTSMGQRRDSLKPAQKISSSPSHNPWHSKAPTHGPEESIGLNNLQQKTEYLSGGPRKGSISNEPRTEGLSTAYSDVKLKESESRLKGQEDYRSTSSKAKQGAFQNGRFAKTSEEDLTELMRLKIAEQQLLEEVSFQADQISNLEHLLTETRERVGHLESELDQNAQKFDEYKQSLENLDRESEIAYENLKRQKVHADEEVQKLLDELDGLSKDLSTKEREWQAQLTLLEDQNTKLQTTIEQNDHQEQMSILRKQVHDLQKELMTTHQSKESLEQELLEVKSSKSSLKADSTAIHIFSLPRPHQEATNPDWAKSYARQQQMIDEIRYLQRQNRELKIHSNAKQSDLTGKSTQGLIDRRQDHSVSEEIEQVADMTTSYTSDPGFSSFNEDRSSGEKQAHSATNTRRAWKGML